MADAPLGVEDTPVVLLVVVLVFVVETTMVELVLVLDVVVDATVVELLAEPGRHCEYQSLV